MQSVKGLFKKIFARHNKKTMIKTVSKSASLWFKPLAGALFSLV